MKKSIKRIGWIDMIVRNPEETSAFYEKVFGFEREPFIEDEAHTSYSLKDGNEEVLGICDAGVFPDWVPGWLPYIEVENYDESISQIEKSHGHIRREMRVNYNWKGQRMCLAIDPSGAPVMICEARKTDNS